MKLVKQRDVDGCGIACVACVSEKPYYKVRRWMCDNLVDVGVPWESVPSRKYPWSHPAKLSWATWMHHLRKALKQFGYKLTRQRNFVSWDALQTDALVAINITKRDSGHWVIYNKKEHCVYDSIGKIRTDLGRMNPCYFAYIRGA